MIFVIWIKVWIQIHKKLKKKTKNKWGIHTDTDKTFMLM